MKTRYFRLCLWFIVLTIALSGLISVEANSSDLLVRDDGLTIVNVSPDKSKEPVQYLTLLIKTGSASDPAGKAGLMDCTNELLGCYFRGSTTASQIGYYTGHDFSCFQFTIAQSNVKKFMEQLDEVLRSDVILAYDFSNWLLDRHKTEPTTPAKPAYINFSEMLYGAKHPYNLRLNPDYKNLNINEINKWFRKVYRPSNFIVSSSFEIPEDFLRRPVGKDFKAPIGLPAIPSPQCDKKAERRFAKVHDNSSTVLMGFPGPKIDEDDYFPFLLGTIYLETELKNKLREESGLIYYVYPDYEDSPLYSPSAPTLSIVLQTLPGDTGTAVAKTIAVLKELSKKGIPEERLTRILQSERNSRALQDKQLNIRTIRGAFQAYHHQNWIADSEEYLSRLEKGAKNVSKVFTDRLPYLKISVAGPEGAEETLKVVNLSNLSQ